MALPRRSTTSRPTLFVLLLASITVLALGYAGPGSVSEARSAFQTVFRPVRSAADTVTRPLRDGWHGATAYERVKEDNDRLRRELDRREGDRVRDRLLEQQVVQLKRMLDVTFTKDLPTVTGRVVSGPLSSFDRTVTIDRGAGEGVKKGMAVVNEAGLAGRVVRADASQAVVQLVTDPSFAVGVSLRPAGTIALARGSGRGKPLKVEDGVDATAPVVEGNDVYTSGVDRSAFPPDVPVGRVTSVRPSGDGTQKVLEIGPIVDVGALTYVRVIIREAQ